ncbi:MAG: 2-C-methyl-D-erythritol 4-phosphate cytidylyltransferase [Planctomycetes bacterium]|nr:2-C-methyl-D-erythritol 4-phosphate cytidylyltransferase [Planctomycetota bacterium]
MASETRIAVILPAAGLGKRFAAAAGDEAPAASKIELPLAGKPVFLRSVELFTNHPAVRQVILAVNPDSIEDFRFRWRDKLAFHAVTIVPGGRAERWETVAKSLEAVAAECTHVAIHDAARPLTSEKLINRVFEAAAKYAAVIPGVGVAATLKRVVAEATTEERDPLDSILGTAGKPASEIRRVVETVDRSALVEVQTPQVFRIDLLRRAYGLIADGRAGGKNGPAITDDAGLVELLGEKVYVVEGESTNLKITRPDDLRLAEAWLQMTEKSQAISSAKKRLFRDEEE